MWGGSVHITAYQDNESGVMEVELEWTKFVKYEIWNLKRSRVRKRAVTYKQMEDKSMYKYVVHKRIHFLKSISKRILRAVFSCKYSGSGLLPQAFISSLFKIG